MRINVVKSFLPPRKEYEAYLDKIWDSHWLTNNGPLLLQLEDELKRFVNNENLIFVSNGTIALQIAIKALKLQGEIITTPYSYCATTTAIIWENCKPVFVDVNEHDYNIDCDLIEEKINKNTSAILATHVYGNPCDILKIEKIAEKHNLKVIYDAAHCFGAKVKGESLLNFGDVATCSFHATKVFHTIEGGSITTNNPEILQQMRYYRSFGHVGDEYFDIGINGKNSEFHAAMGLCNLPYLEELIQKRKLVNDLYDSKINFAKVSKPISRIENFESNYAYYPIVLETEEVTNEIISELAKSDIIPRRYFYPSLNKLSYVNSDDKCPVSESVVNRVLSIPFYPDLELEHIDRIAKIINQTTA